MYYTPNDDDNYRMCINEELFGLKSNFPQDSDVTMNELNKENPISYTNNAVEHGVIPSKEKKQGVYNYQPRQAPMPPALPQQNSPYSYGYPNLYPPAVPNNPVPYPISYQPAPVAPQISYNPYLPISNSGFGGAGNGGGMGNYDSSSKSEFGGGSGTDQVLQERLEEAIQEDQRRPRRTSTPIPIKWRTQPVPDQVGGLEAV